MEKHKEIIEKLRFELGETASDILAKKLKGMIISGELAPGYLFPNEKIFCEQLRVSRSTLREAYKVLECTGFISRKKGRGTVVNDFKAISRVASFITSAEMSNLSELMDFREMIEGELAKLAAERATEESIAKIESALDGMIDNVDDLTKLAHYDTRFHLEIANASNNRLMISTMSNVESVFNRGVYQAFHIDRVYNISQAVKYHTMILSAIRNRDAAMAEKLMRQHIRNIQHRLSFQHQEQPDKSMLSIMENE